MKKALFFMMLAVLFAGCSKSETEKEENYYSEAQKQVFAMMHGTFKYETYGVVTTVTFGQQYPKPIEATYVKDGSKTEIHGELTIKYWNGDTYKRYYRLFSDAKGLSMYDDKQSISLIYYKNFQYVDDNTFRWKDQSATLWDTYKRN